MLKRLSHFFQPTAHASEVPVIASEAKQSGLLSFASLWTGRTSQRHVNTSEAPVIASEAKQSRLLRPASQRHVNTSEAPVIASEAKQSATAISGRVDDSPGWSAYTNRPHDYDPAKIQEIYADALEAWRKNPIAWRAVAITTDYIVGDKISISSPNRNLNQFIRSFWNHPKNNLSQRFDSMSEELCRAGDLFVTLHLNPLDGMSYIRFVTKDKITQIITAENDWETELKYIERRDIGEPMIWHGPASPEADSQPAIMLHYSINRPIGALLGESDLVTMIPWLLRYSRMLEDRVRLNWAMRAFLWFVTVPTAKVKEKQEMYRTPPDAGSIIVKDESERWETNSPTLHAVDARHDMQAVRAMIDAGSGYPPHWRGDAGDISLATAQAMQGPTERHLRRRQQFFIWMLQDIIYQAYQRAVNIGAFRPMAGADYETLFRVSSPEISRWDNESLASSAEKIGKAFADLTPQLKGLPESYARLLLSTAFKFMGEPLSEDSLAQLIQDLEANPSQPAESG